MSESVPQTSDAKPEFDLNERFPSTSGLGQENGG
jgi:hypothetical protein